MASRSNNDFVKEIRDNIKEAMDSDSHNREAYRDNEKFLNLDQWDSLEANRRLNKRLMLTADQLNAPVDQVVNQVRQNKPGPSVRPSGEGTDKDDAQIMEGLMRRIDYENNATATFVNVFECATGGNFGCMGLDIDYKNERSFQRVIKVRFIPDANEKVFFDPNAIERDRSDSEWAAEIQDISKSKLKTAYPQSKINQMGKIESLFDYFIASYTDPGMTGWVTKNTVRIAKYWKVHKKMDMLRMYTNDVAYFDSESAKIPKGVEPKENGSKRNVERKEIKWYITDGIDILDEGDWEGLWIPLFPCYGKERWIKGKRYIVSMIQGAKQAQQAFNYAFTGACEVLSITTKAPWLGLLGQFKSKMKQWQQANTDPQPYLEYDEVPLADGTTHVTPPVRNIQEPPIQAFIQFCQMCTNAIQRATSVFDPSLGKQKSDQSGRAIQELQQQSVEGNFHWSDNLTVTLTHYYRSLLDIVQKEFDAAQVTQILRADNTPLEARINEDFHAGDDIEGKPITKHYRIAKGNYAVTVNIGPSADSLLQANESKVTQLIKVLPPELVAQAADIFVRLQNYGQLGEQLAERLTPPQFRNQNDPQAAAAHLAQAMQQNQQLMATVQKLQFAISSKAPELEVRKWIAAVNAIAGIEETKLKIGDNNADRAQDMVQHAVGLAHDATEAQRDREHEVGMGQQDQDHEATESAVGRMHESDENSKTRLADLMQSQIGAGKEQE